MATIFDFEIGMRKIRGKLPFLSPTTKFQIRITHNSLTIFQNYSYTSSIIYGAFMPFAAGKFRHQE